MFLQDFRAALFNTIANQRQLRPSLFLNTQYLQNCSIKSAIQVGNFWRRLDMEGVSISSLARESRLVFVIYGRTLQPQDSNNDSNDTPQYKQEELGWAAVQFFDYNG